MKILKSLKARAKNLKKEIIAVYYAYQSPKVSLLPKIFILAALGYALSPIDLIPDFIPVLGYLDDLIIIPALIHLSIRFIPAEIMAEAREKAKNQPLQLKKNWGCALLFIFIWLVLLAVIVLSVAKIFIK
jgi:uncharacterized membrane protein YkvA (DUF1232 family)